MMLPGGIHHMNTRKLWSRILVIVGSIAMLVGALDPLEGSLIILPGSGLVTFGTFLGNNGRELRIQWLCSVWQKTAIFRELIRESTD
jgi:hypothetical protein